jgi:RimJ/RimL family protein N-acetyltransferase
MDTQTSLYEDEHIRLGPIDHDQDAEIEVRWTHDTEYLRLRYLDAVMPLSAAQLKKRYEAFEKKASEEHNCFYFTIRLRQDDRLIGNAQIEWIEWSHGNAHLRLGIGAAADRRQGYGRAALELLLRFAFRELNLHRMSVVVAEDNPAALRFFQRAGFQPEARRREALQRAGCRWDLIHLGLLRDEWIEPNGLPGAAPAGDTA